MCVHSNSYLSLQKTWVSELKSSAAQQWIQKTKCATIRESTQCSKKHTNSLVQFTGYMIT